MERTQTQTLDECAADVATKLFLFHETRRLEEKEEFHAIVAVGARVGLASCAIYVIAMLVDSEGQRFANAVCPSTSWCITWSQMGQVISAIGVCWFAAGALILSCAVTEVDEREFVRGRPFLSTGCAAIVVMMDLMTAAAMKPHVHLASALVAGVSGVTLFLASEAKGCWLTAAKSFVLYFVTNLVANLCARVWAATHAESTRIYGLTLPAAPWYASALAIAGGLAVTLGRYLWRRWWYPDEVSPALAACSAGDAAFVTWGAMDLIPGFAAVSTDRVGGLAVSVRGLGYAVPAIVKWWFGRDRVYQSAARRFNRRLALKDGAFIAGLLDSSAVIPGQVWWVHRAVGEEAKEYPPTDARRNWRQGRIDEVFDDSFTVIVGGELRRPSASSSALDSSHSSMVPISSMGTVGTLLGSSPGSMMDNLMNFGCKTPSMRVPQTVHTFPMKCRNVPWEQLMRQAQHDLRCIEWRHVTRELMQSSTPCDDWEKVTTRVSVGKKIDYFMSHSWHDDAEAKYVQLEVVSAEFTQSQKHGDRPPTFWLDKVCIDQNNIADCLRVLPVNVMACRRMLVLYGRTYPGRLWCIWELFTLLSFVRIEHVFGRLHIAPLNEDGPVSTVTHWDTSRTSGIAGQLLSFDVANARCYDPNEEDRLLTIITALGKDRFNERVHALGQGVADQQRSQSEDRRRTRFGRMGSAGWGDSSMRRVSFTVYEMEMKETATSRHRLTTDPSQNRLSRPSQSASDRPRSFSPRPRSASPRPRSASPRPRSVSPRPTLATPRRGEACVPLRYTAVLHAV